MNEAEDTAMTGESDTPRTDAEVRTAEFYTWQFEYVYPDHARTLEHELSAAQENNRKLALHTAEQATELGKLRDQLAAAESECAIRNDEVSGLQGKLSEARARIAELEKLLTSSTR